MGSNGDDTRCRTSGRPRRGRRARRVRAVQQGHPRGHVGPRHRSRACPRCRHCTPDRGVGLAEVLIAFAILMLVLVPVSYLLDNVLGQAATARNKVQALSIAEKWIEKLNACGPPTSTPPTPAWCSSTPPSTPGLPVVGKSISVGTRTIGGTRGTTSATINYFPTARFTWLVRTLTGATQPDLCTSGIVPKTMSLTVTVAYPGGKVLDTTEIDYPPPGLPVDGFLGVQIDGSPQSATDPTPAPTRKRGVAWGARVETVTVTVTTATTTSKTYSQYPATDGCALFELPVGTYSVQVGPDTSTTPTTPFVAPGSITATTVTSTTPLRVQLSKVTEAGPYLYDEGAYVNVAYPDSTVTDNAITCPNVDSFQCLVDGQGTTSGATAAVNVLSGSSWKSRNLPASAGIQKIVSAACTSAACVGVGFGAGGGAAVVDDPSHITEWAPSSPQTSLHVSMIRHVECPTASDCLAIGTTEVTTKATTVHPVVLGAKVSTGSGAPSLSWVADAISTTSTPIALSTVTQLVCAGSSACFMTGTDSSGPVVLVGAATGGSETWHPEKGISMTSIAGIACAGTSACLVDGTSAGPAVSAGAVSPTPTTWEVAVLPVLPAKTRLSSLTCVGTAVCLATGNSTSGPSVVLGAPSATAPKWTATTVTLPSTLTSATLLSCGSSSCVVIGSKGPTDSVITTGPAATGAHTWKKATLTGVPGGLSLTHVHCAGTTTCVVVGAHTATTAAVLLTGKVSATSATFTEATFPPTTFTTTASSVTGQTPTSPVHLAADVAHANVPKIRDHSSSPAPHSAAEAACYGCYPRITSVTPSSGPTGGGTDITLHVSNFTLHGTPYVQIGGNWATTAHVTVTNSEVTAVTPAHYAGTVSIRLYIVHYNWYQTVTLRTGFTYVAQPPPTISAVAPTKGPTTGGTSVTITGTHFTKASSVKFGGKAATTVTVVSPTKITAITPSSSAAGVVSVSVTTPGGTVVDPTSFTYFYAAPRVSTVTPTTGPTTGGTTVTITGTHFSTVTSVTFGGTPATTVTVVRSTGSTKLTATTPAHGAGTVAVAVTNRGGTYTDATAFTFVTPKPNLISVTPATGTTAGGTVVSISGHFLTTPSSVTFGGAAATNVTVVSPTRITVTTPAHTAGAVTVVVTTPGGSATKATAFTYVKPRPTAPVYFSGVSCYSAPPLTCVAAGATEYGAVLLVGTLGATGFTWVSDTPVTATHTTRPVPGLVEPDLPISVRNAALPSSYFTPCTATGTRLCTSIGPLFPYASGYTVGAGNCLAELATSAPVESIPGTPPATSGPPATVPLGLLAVQVLRGGKPVAGANITATVDDATLGCNKPKIALGTTEADGTLALASILEHYTITATSSGKSKTVTVTVTPDEIVNMTTTATALLPAPLIIRLPT